MPSHLGGGAAPTMDQSLTFGRHFARLVWLLLHETENIDEQKANLRALVTLSREGAVTLAVRDWQVTANGELLPPAFTGAAELGGQMTGHGITGITIDASASPADVLGAARIIAGDVMASDGGRATLTKIRALAPKTVTFAHRPEVFAPPVPTPPTPAPAVAPPVRQPVAAPAATAPSTGGVESPSDIVHGEGMWAQFSATRAPAGSADDLFVRLDKTQDVGQVTVLLDDLVTVAETAAREGKALTVADVCHGVVLRESRHEDGDLKRAYVMAVRRLARPALLRAVANLLPRKREKFDEYMTVLIRTGEDGADALIEQLTQATTADERRTYYDALLKLQAGVPALIHMLGDARWYVVRNAADLLGEMKAPEAETALVSAFHHRDDRVRRAASTALVALGTPGALKAVHDALRDESPQVRTQAAAALAARGDERSAPALVKALDEEQEEHVQHVLLSALGKVRTNEAVKKLIGAAESEGRFFKRKPTPYRLAAIQALGDAKTPAALAALTTLQEDREREVREAAAKVLQLAQKK